MGKPSSKKTPSDAAPSKVSGAAQNSDLKQQDQQKLNAKSATSTTSTSNSSTPQDATELPATKKKGILSADEPPAEQHTGLCHLVTGVFSAWLPVAVMLSLIFGGCCSNVYALESIVKAEPASGTLLTFVQFLFVAVTGYIAQFDRTRAPFFLTPNKVPIKRWLVNIVLFFSINIMNNHAFSYNISVPVHIILRSGGSITTIAAGFLWGKRYSRIQVTAVMFLTVGVITAAYSDAQSKGKAGGKSSSSDVSMGLIILFVAQVLSAIMGIYTEETYKKYGPQWRENLFYSHILSLPLFLPLMPSLIEQFSRLANSPPMTLSVPAMLVSKFDVGFLLHTTSVTVPSQLVHLVLNVLTQYACIRGVNLLAAASTALTVTIVLNIRKLVSLLLSIILFGNQLAIGTLVGAVVVFGSGALYSLDSSGRRKAKPSQAHVQTTQPQTPPKNDKQAGQKKMA